MKQYIQKRFILRCDKIQESDWGRLNGQSELSVTWRNAKVVRARSHVTPSGAGRQFMGASLQRLRAWFEVRCYMCFGGPHRGLEVWNTLPGPQTGSGCWPIRKDCCINQAQESFGKRGLRSVMAAIKQNTRLAGEGGNFIQNLFLAFSRVSSPRMWEKIFQ